jgi:hypothetical protein
MEAHRLQEVHPMSESAPASFVSRVFSNDAFRKGCSSAIAGLIIATVLETVFSSNR